MQIVSFFTAAEVDPAALAGRVAVVIDVVRATSVMVEALANGARAIHPTLTPADAVTLASTLGREDSLLCGERRGLKVDGFDLGNSPREFATPRVKGKRLVMSTTNGTRAFYASMGATRVYALALSNLGAVARQVRDEPAVALVCAGRDNRFALDDVVCAGLLIDEIHRQTGEEPQLDEASLAALTLSRGVAADEAFFRSTAAGAAIVEIGLGEDLAFLAQRDRHSIVPEMNDRIIRIAEAPSRP